MDPVKDTDEWQAAFDNVEEAMQRELKARRKIIKDYNALPEVQHIRDRMKRFKKSFADMITPENAFSYNDIVVNFMNPGIYDESAAGEYQAGAGVECLYIKREALDDDPTLLHEMLHLHENHMTGEERAQYYAVLLGKIKRKLPYIDILLGEKDGYLYGLWEEGNPDPKAHDNLFFLKSIDLDLRKGYPLGTVHGYRAPAVISEILKKINGFSEMRETMKRIPTRRGPFSYDAITGPKEKRGLNNDKG